ncbi:MAG: type IIL restriction-modification enzyme MmeI [Euryarchaeota archaeon]|nr:type IIL restriction-modification enzyme MmeI [Euryarchaeota archaeon]
MDDIAGVTDRHSLMAFLNSLNYQTEEIILDKELNLELSERAKDIIKSIALISDYKTDGTQFRIYVIEAERLRRTDIRAVLEPFYNKHPQVNTLFVFTTEEYNPLVLVSPQRVLSPEDRTKKKTKLKLRILQIDRDNVYHTDLEVLEALKLAPGEADPWAKHLDAFSIERVTEKFFKTYKDKFDHLKEALESNKRKIIFFKDEKYLETFAQRILGRLIFLYFLQKKKWLNGDKKFVGKLLDRAEQEHKNFYNDFLEPLFFEVLNKPRTNYDSQFGTIPYLNGGLFEKDYNFDVKLPNAIFREIIDFFNLYNFTVQENTPLEVEVSLDPELLGKLFENMLAEKERGAKGTFYTPRPVVHYMCRESLKEYLAGITDIARHKVLALVEDSSTEYLSGDEAEQLYKSLDKVRILDPAVGSGAFLVGLMHEIIRLKTALAAELERAVTNAQLKREIIKSNLYGVDIEPEAIEIARLRLWLSLVVDEELDYVEPLPNLDYKLLVGNSLVESWRGKKLLEKGVQKTFVEDETLKLIEELRNLKGKLLNETDMEEKKKLRERSEEIEWLIIEKWLTREAERKTREAIEISGKYKWVEKGIPKKEKKKLKRLKEEAENAGKLLNELKQSGEKSFFLPQIHFAEVYTEKGGFDIVIANPPYVRTQKLSELPYRDDLKLHYGFIDDFYVHFSFRAFELARPKGIVTFITSDTYLTLAWKERMRELLQANRIRRLILTPKAFQATVNTAIYIVQRERLADYNFTFLDAREVSGDEKGSWEDQLIVFEGLKEIEAYDTQNAVRIGDKELEVSNPREIDPIGQYRVPVELYKKAVKRVFFTPNKKNLKLYEQFMPKMNELYEEWWSKIKSSKDIQKNKKEIEKYLRTLKPGDITLLGLITEGGQGLATADNGSFLAVLEGTEEAKRIEERLEEFERKWERKEPKIFEKYQELLAKRSRNGARDKLRKEFEEKELGFPRGFIYKVIKKEDVFDAGSYLESLAPEIRDVMRRVIIFGGVPEKESDVKSLWKLSKLPDDLKGLGADLKKRVVEEYRGLTNEGKWIVLEKNTGQEEIYWAPNIYFIDWSRGSVKWLFENSGKKGAAMPVIRNPDYYFRGGVSMSSISESQFRVKIAEHTVFEHKSHVLEPHLIIEELFSANYLTAFLSSNFAFYLTKEYLNHTVEPELNDLRLLPIVIPTETQRKEIENLVEEAIEIQKKRYASEEKDEKVELWKELQEVQKRINGKVEGIYGGS